MRTILLCVLSTSAALTLPALVCLLISPLLEKRYSPKALYIASVLLVIGFLIPFSMLIPRPLVTVDLPEELSRTLFVYSAPAKAGTQQAEQLLEASRNSAETADEQGAAGTAEDAGSTSAAGGSAAAVTPVKATESGLVYQENGAGRTAAGRGLVVNWISVLGWVWAAGAAGFLALQLLHHIRFVRTLHRWRKPCVAEGYLQTMAEAQADMDIRSSIALYIYPAVSGPMLLGLLRPAIYLPDEALTTDELTLVLRHELTHYQRRDLLVKCALLLCRSVHWFNPVLLPLSRWLCYCQEASCDSRVTRTASAEERRFYSETIIRVIRRQVQARTQLCTSFYGGKNGMKKRIFSIMNMNKRKAGVLLCLCLLCATLICGGMLALNGNIEMAYPQNAWVHSRSEAGTVLLTGPTANDLNCPMGIYLNGTPVTILQVEESSSGEGWNSKEGEPNWAEVLIGGDGYEKGIHGWVPLHDLVYENADQLPAATLSAGSDSGHTQLYAINDRETPVTALRQDGTEVLVLGQLNHWLHVLNEDKALFVLADHVSLSPEADQRLFDLLPERFGGTTRAEYDSDYTYNKLYNEKAALYGGRALEYWSVEDKAWFGQLEEAYLHSHDHYYLLPGEEDLPREKAVEIALAAYAETAGLESVTTEDVDVYPGFYRFGYTDPLYWDVIITSKGTTVNLAWVTISSPEGEVVYINGTAPAENNNPMFLPDGNG